MRTIRPQDSNSLVLRFHQMSVSEISLEPLKEADRDQFIRDNQEAFKYGATEEFGLRDDRFEEPGEIFSRRTIERCLDHGDAYRILSDEKAVGGAIVAVSGNQGELEILFVSPQEHSKGIGYAAWCAIEKMYP